MTDSAVTRAKLESIVEAGILAPSADNRQLVEFEFSENGIGLLGNTEFANAPFHRKVLCLIGFGAVVENMLLRASRLGLTGEVEWFPDPAQRDLIAQVRLRAGSTGAEDIEAAIASRHTNRRFFRGPRMTHAERRTFESDVARVPGVKLLWFDEPGPRRRILRLLRTAESERFRSQPLHEDLFSSIRFDIGWAATADHGLPPGALEIEAPLRRAFAALRSWPLMRALNAIGAHYLIGVRAADAPCRFTPHLCALATTLTLEHGCTAVGRALERAWLRAGALGLAFQPFAAPALLALDGYRDVRGCVRTRLANGWAELAPGVTPLIVFRIGRANAPRVRSKRRPAQHYIR